MKNQELNILAKYLSRIDLKSKQINVLESLGREYLCIEWYSNDDERKRTYEEDILLSVDENLSAFIVESKINEQFKYNLTTIKNGEINLQYELKTYDRDDDRIGNLYLSEHDTAIVCIYQNGDTICLLSIMSNDKIETLFYQGELIERNKNLVAIERYQDNNKNKPIELFELPSLKSVGEITREEALNINLMPTGNKPKNYLKNKTNE